MMNSGNGKQPLSRTLRIYQKAAIVFVLISFVLLLGVLYLSLSRAKIFITPSTAVLQTSVPVEIVANPVTSGQMSGYIMKETFTKATLFQTPEEGGQLVEGKATGMVTLINETSSPQALVATTRLLSKEGVLFRLNDAVNIPAQGQIEARVTADQPGKDGDIFASQFTIPGLSANLQSVIYAVSVDPMKGGLSMVSVVTEEYLNEAEQKLKEEMTAEALNSLQGRIPSSDFDGHVVMVEVLERKSDKMPGEQASDFTVSLTAQVTTIFYKKSLLEQYVLDSLKAQMQAGYELKEADTEGIQVSVDSVSSVTETATLTVYIDGTAVISQASELLKPERFIGFKAEEVVSLLTQSESIASARVQFSPFWLRRVPRLTDHIEIIIE